VSVAQALPGISSLRAGMKNAGQKIDRLSLRERILVFGSAVVLMYVAWQSQVMDPLALRAQQVTTRVEASQQLVEGGGTAGQVAEQDPAVLAVAREQALRERLATLELQLETAAKGYVPPERMVEMLGSLLRFQPGLRLVNLRKLPVEELAQAGEGKPANGPVGQGPFLHPIEIVCEGDYLTIVAYLKQIEQLPWRLHWRQVDIVALRYPLNRVRIEIGTLGLSRDWLTV